MERMSRNEHSYQPNPTESWPGNKQALARLTLPLQAVQCMYRRYKGPQMGSTVYVL